MPAHPLQALWAALALDIPLVATAGKALPTSRNWEEFASDGTATPRPGAAVMISPEELSRHGSPADCWVTVGDTVYDLTSIEKDWPGGKGFLKACGADATPRWEAVRSKVEAASGVREWLAARIKGQYFASAGRVSADSEPQLPSRALFSKQDAGGAGPKKSKKKSKKKKKSKGTSLDEFKSTSGDVPQSGGDAKAAPGAGGDHGGNTDDKLPSEEFASAVSTTPRPGAAVMISREELSRHGSPADCWAAVGDTVYDLTSVEKDWPGGEAFLEACGADATPRWEAVRGTMKTGSGVHEWLAARIKGQYFASAGRVSADSEPQLPSRALFSKQDAGGPKKSKKGKKSLVELPKSTSGSGGKDALGEMRGRGPIGETNGSSLVELHHGDPDDDGEDGDGKYGGDDDDEALAQTAERKARSGSSRNRHDDAGEGDDDDDEDDEDDDDDDEALAQTSGRETRKSNRHRRAAADEGPYDAKGVELARVSHGQADAPAPLMRRVPIA